MDSKPKAFIYIDNFRGFSDQIIPVYDVNFLVGENSTGKTSLLSILNLLSVPVPQIMNAFNDERIGLGSFQEMVNNESPTPQYFSVGIFSERSLFFVRFKEESGKAIPYRICYPNDEKILHLRLFLDVWEYKTVDCPRDENGLAQLSEEIIYSLVVHEQSQENGDGYQAVKGISIKNGEVSGPTIDDVVYFQEQKNNDTGIIGNLTINFMPSIVLRLMGAKYINNLAWIAPIRAKPQRTYDKPFNKPSSEGDHIPYLIKELVGGSEKDKEMVEKLNAFGQKSELFDSISVKSRAHDYDAPFEIHLEIGNKELKSVHVGYGISQIIPVVVEILMNAKDSWIAIQQPEVHLHPKAQAEFGDLVFEIAEQVGDDRACFMIETHSDFIIDRFRLNYLDREGGAPSLSSQVLFFERTEQGNQVHSLPIDEQGMYPEDQPESFQAFFIREELKLLRL